MKYHDQKRKIEALETRFDLLQSDYLQYRRVLANLDECAGQLEQARLKLAEIEKNRTVADVQPIKMEIV